MSFSLPDPCSAKAVNYSKRPGRPRAEPGFGRFWPVDRNNLWCERVKYGLRFPTDTPVEQWDAFAAGQIEVQDHASQLAIGVVAAQPGETVVDLCAGAGGKTLGLAADMDNKGRLVACDVSRERLARLAPRAERAGALGIETLLLDGGREARALAPLMGKADAVLVDAPCSGSGTWRRSPEGRWRLNPAELARLTALQARVLGLGSGLVRSGAPAGIESLSHREHQVFRLLISGRTVTPGRFSTGTT